MTREIKPGEILAYQWRGNTSLYVCLSYRENVNEGKDRFRYSYLLMDGEGGVFWYTSANVSGADLI